MSVRVDILHIGTLSRNPYWNDKVPKRPAVATMSLLTDGDKTVLVDPGLPPELIAAALDQRCGKSPEDIDFVFLTNRRPAHVRGLSALPNAKALMFEREIEQWAGDPEAPRQMLERVRPAPERVTERIHLFPTPGPTRGHCSLLVLSATANIMVAGDAVLTRDHYEHGAVYEKCDDREAAKESLAEVIELADVIIPGHDNIFFAKAGGMF
jgi:glyoxylase-like metal-dependent hydrolase (beta-lactamase superfamily II)